MKAAAVIGANYGDEGKGLMTDYLCSKHGSDVVVRFNGGAQAGHTVVTRSGERHVFSHFSSGTFTGAATYLSEDFVCNPMLFIKEIRKLPAFRRNPTVYVHPKAIVTTPYDMMLNQIVESFRNKDRHGSCGVGFGETIERNLNEDLAFTIGASLSEVDKKLAANRIYFFERLNSVYGISKTDIIRSKEFDKVLDVNYFKTILNRYKTDLIFLKESVQIADYLILRNAHHIVFEGAQGLLLDQDIGAFPHVTRSNTGLKNVLKIAREINVEELEAVYVTRTFLTRHGAGPLENELQEHKLPTDFTNVTNKFQGSLRYAQLDKNLWNRIYADYALYGINVGIPVRATVAVTHMDYVDYGTNLFKEDSLIPRNRIKYISFGSDRGFVQENFDYLT